MHDVCGACGKWEVDFRVPFVPDAFARGHSPEVNVQFRAGGEVEWVLLQSRRVACQQKIAKRTAVERFNSP